MAGSGWKSPEKTICDVSGRKSKVIGSIRNIQEQKKRSRWRVKAARVDPVTGPYREKSRAGDYQSGGRSSDGPVLCFLWILISSQEMNDGYGIEFGDSILEEIGIFILKLKSELEKSGKRIVTAVRAGGDEILMWCAVLKNRRYWAYLTD